MSDSVPGKQSSQDELENKAEKSRNCEPCEEDGVVIDAFGFCVDCQNYLCESCFKCHCIPKPMKKHRLLNTSEMPRKKVSEDLSEICKKHEDETIKYYCKYHKVVGCNSCMLLEHKPCQEICGLGEMAQDVETSQPYIELCNNLDRIEDNCDRQLINAHANTEDSNLFYEKAIVKVEQLRKEMNAHFDLLHESIEKDAREKRDTDVAKMKDLIEATTSVQAEQIQIKEDLEILAETKQTKQLFIALNKSKKQVDSLKQKLSEIAKENDVTKYIFKETHDIRSILGNISSVGYLLEEDKDIELRPSLTNLDSYPEFGIVKRAKLFENCTVSVDPVEKAIELYEDKQEIVKVIQETPPWDVCSIMGYEFAVTLPYERKIKVFSKREQMLTERMEIKVDAQCEGIHFALGRFFVACSEPGQVLILSYKGDLLRTVSKHQTTGLAIFSRPAYVHISSGVNLIMYVTDRASEKVILLSLDGNFFKVHKRNVNKEPLWALKNEYYVSSFKMFQMVTK